MLCDIRYGSYNQISNEDYRRYIIIGNFYNYLLIKNFIYYIFIYFLVLVISLIMILYVSWKLCSKSQNISQPVVNPNREYSNISVEISQPDIPSVPEIIQSRVQNTKKISVFSSQNNPLTYEMVGVDHSFHLIDASKNEDDNHDEISRLEKNEIIENKLKEPHPGSDKIINFET